MVYNITYMWNIKNTTNITKKEQIHKHSKQTSGYQWEREGGRHNIGLGE